MTEQQACTLCGAGGHTAAQCHWNAPGALESIQLPKHCTTIALEEMLAGYLPDDRQDVREAIEAYADIQARKAVMLFSGTAQARVAELEADVKDADGLSKILGDLLREIDLTIRGPEPALTRSGYPDLPQRVKTLVEERDAAQSRVAELPLLTLCEMENLHDFYGSLCDGAGHRVEKDGMRRLAELGAVESIGFGKHRLTKFGEYLLSIKHAPVSQAGQVPEDMRFEYRHPNGERHTVTISRQQVIDEMPDFLFEALCSKFCNCEPVGETNVVECRCDEYAEEFQLVTAAPAPAQGGEA